MERNKVTLKDIARRAKVSESLVSRIMNGKGIVSREVRERVTALLKASGYRPKYARKPILFILSYPSSMQNRIPLDDEFPHLLGGIHSVLAEEGCTLIVQFVLDAEADDAVIESRLKQAAQREPGGVFINTDTPWFSTAKKIFEEEGIPLVQIGFEPEEPRVDAVVVDSFSETYMAVRHLAKQGHTRVALIRYEVPANKNRKFAGYLAGLADSHIDFKPEYVRSVTTSPSKPGWVSSRDLLMDLLSLPEPPTALVVDNTFLSSPLIYPLATDGGVLPDTIRGISMVHCEDLPMDAFERSFNRVDYPPRSATFVAIDWHAIGSMGARIMLDRLSGIIDSGPRIVRTTPVLQRVEGWIRTKI